MSAKLKKNLKYYLPIIIFLYSILVLYIKKITYDFSAFSWIESEKIVYDVFSYFKGRTIILAAVIAILLIVYDYLLGELDLKSFGKKYVLFWIMTFFILLSYSNSDFKEIALRGFFERYEGLFVSISYLIMSIYTAYVLKEKKVDLNHLMTVILILSGILGVIGTLQYFKIDIFRMPWFRRFLIDPVLGTEANVNFKMPEGRVYLTVYNPNYVGVVMSILIMIATNILIFDKSKVNKVLSVIVLPLLLISLYGSYSRGGMFALLIGMVVFFLVNFKKILKHKVVFLISFVLISSVTFLVNQQMDDFVQNRFKSIFNIEKQEYTGLKNIETTANSIKISYNDNEYSLIKNEDSSLGLVLETDEGIIEPIVKDQKYIFDYKDLSNIPIGLGEYQNRRFWQFVIDRKKWNFSDQGDSIKYINELGKLLDLKIAPYAEFLKGYERVGSGRVYIWSRTLPLIKETIITGYGPDTYALVFPQEDYISKSKFLNPRSIIVDKPHNTYLQYLINFGIPATIAFISLLILTVWKNIKKYKDANFHSSLVISTLAVIMVVLLFNDSTVSTSPLIWTCIGIGYGNII